MRIGLVILLFFATLHAIYIYFNLDYIGFPDGSKTEVDLINEKLFPLYIAIDIIFSFFLTYEFFVKRKNFNLKWLIILYLAFIGLTILVETLLNTYLDHGQGG